MTKISIVTPTFNEEQNIEKLCSEIKIEMEKATKKENYLTEDERILINKFISKIKSELNTSINN